MDQTLAHRMEKLFTPAISDLLDQKEVSGCLVQRSFHQVIPGRVAFGRAFTMEFGRPVETYGRRKEELSTDELVKRIESIFAPMQPGDVICITTNGLPHAGVWGELMSTIAKYTRGAKAAVVDGSVRDTSRIVAADFPVWCTGFHPGESFGRMDFLGSERDIWLGEVLVKTGDYVFADCDGVVVIPAGTDIAGLVSEAEAMVDLENKARADIRAGVSVEDVFRKYGVI